MDEADRLAGLDHWGDVAPPRLGMHFVGERHDHQVRAGHCLCGVQRGKSIPRGALSGRRIGPSGHPDRDTGLPQVQRMCPPLVSIADEGNVPARQGGGRKA